MGIHMQNPQVALIKIVEVLNCREGLFSFDVWYGFAVVWHYPPTPLLYIYSIITYSSFCENIVGIMQQKISINTSCFLELY